MFRNTYQGGPVVEIFTGHGKDPVAKWKLCGGPSAIHKEFSNELKGFVYCLEGSSQTVKMQMPTNGKMSLGLLQRFLVLQLNVPHSEDFSIELTISDSEHLKKRLHLSTVHKEVSVNPLHAKIPFAGLTRNIWSTLCIDLVSFAGKLFKGFLTLDSITLFATCKVRRIFTMKIEPAGILDDDMYVNGGGLMDLIPRNCHFPPHVNNVTQVLNMENLQKTELRAEQLIHYCQVPDRSASSRTTSYGRTRPQGVLHTASGSKIPGPRLHTGKKSSTVSDGVNRSELHISNTGSSSSKISQKVAGESQNFASLSENVFHGETSYIHLEETPGRLQPQSPKDKEIDKPGSKKPGVFNFAPGVHSQESNAREKCTPPSSREESRQQPLTQHLMTDECSNSPIEENSGASPAAESLSCSNWPDLPCDLQVCSNWENNEESEPQLSLHEEDMKYTTIQHQRTCVESIPPSPRSPNPTLDMQLEVYSEFHNMDQTPPVELSPPATSLVCLASGKGEPTLTVPNPCLSPWFTRRRQQHKCGPCGSGRGNQDVDGKGSASLSRRPLQAVESDEFGQHEEEDDRSLSAADSSGYNLHELSCIQIHGDDEEELRMLASLKREQEEDECRASGLSASQIHQCNISISSDGTSPWIHSSMPSNQGHHYQKEMSPLLQSNPREWMDVLSPPINPPSQQRRSGKTWNNPENLVGGGCEAVHEEENGDECLNLSYDPCLNCYFDPKTGKYYELA